MYISLQDAGKRIVNKEFMEEVGKVLREADFPTKSEVITALAELLSDPVVPRDAVLSAIYAVLRGSDGTLTPNYTREEYEQFLQAALPILFTIADHDKDFLVELMFAYMEGGEATRYCT